MSGYKGASYVDNAKYHEGQNFFLLIDIKGFYPSITKEKIKKSLILQYEQSSDVAEFISNLVSVEQTDNKVRALPTGSTISQNMAFFVNREMFDELYEVAQKNGINMTVYVDDVSFSSKATIPHNFVNTVLHIVKKYGYQIATNKMYYGKPKAKNDNAKSRKRLDITGTQVTKDGAFLTASRKDRIKLKREMIKLLIKEEKTYDKEKLSFIASIQQAMLVNPKYRRYLQQVQSHI